MITSNVQDKRNEEKNQRSECFRRKIVKRIRNLKEENSKIRQFFFPNINICQIFYLVMI